MDVEQFMREQTKVLDEAKQRYLVLFGESVPDLDNVDWWGNELNLIEQSIKDGIPIRLNQLADDEDL